MLTIQAQGESWWRKYGKILWYWWYPNNSENIFTCIKKKRIPIFIQRETIYKYVKYKLLYLLELWWVDEVQNDILQAASERKFNIIITIVAT